MRESAYIKIVRDRIETLQRRITLEDALAFEEARTYLSKNPKSIRDRATRRIRRYEKALFKVASRTALSIEEEALLAPLKRRFLGI